MNKRLQINSLRGFISLLLKTVILIGLLSSVSFADNGLVFPDSAQMNFIWTVDNDTVTVLIQNQSGNPVDNFFFSDHTSSSVTLIDCIIDGVVSSPTSTETSSNSVYSGEETTRFMVSSFNSLVILKYYPFSYKFSFSAGAAFPCFGVSGKIGPAQNIQWSE